MAKRINWNATKADAEKITQIMLRAASMLNFEEQFGLTWLDVSMDLTACHLNGCSLDLDGLLNAERFDFVHDITGICRHIDRTTGELRNCFDPRYSAKVATTA